MALALPSTTVISLGQSVALLTGPWRFHTGDDVRWADPRFDDSSWETVDLTPNPGARDDDVGYTDYVPGWNLRGHRGYSGYAWYRMRIAVSKPQNMKLALLDAFYVDSAHQVFFNGRLLGGSGRFGNRRAPVIFSRRPRLFDLPAGDADAVVAIRVWVGPGKIASARDAGGMHITPAIGEAGAVHDQYLRQWRETFLGYAVDVAPGLLLVMIATMAAGMGVLDRPTRAYLWMAGAVLAIGLLRLHQAVYAWFQFEDAATYGVVRYVLLEPLSFGAWIMAWRAWFDSKGPRWVMPAASALTVIYVLAQLSGLSWNPSAALGSVASASRTVSTLLQWVFAGLYLFVAVLGVSRSGVRAWLALLGMATVAANIFGAQLGVFHVKEIWFPYGVGVSLSEYACVALTPVLFILLFDRFRRSYAMLAAGFAEPEPVA